MENDMKIVADRWMLESRQLVNWGSYDGYQEFKPSIDAHVPVTLLAGASESGKSTLVDAQISLLYPSGTPYNKASNSGRSERNDYTYLRGMIGVGDSADGEKPVFLRGRDSNGTPQSVWGAIVDTYVNRTGGGVLSCAKFLYLSAGDGKDEVRRRYVAWNGKIDPRAMDQYRDTPFSANMFRKTYPECTVFPNANAFHTYVWHEMGLSAEACRLLHKVQSADAPSRLDDIFKQGVLNVPEALGLAQDTVDDYDRFNENFHSMESKARRVEKLQGIQSKYDAYCEHMIHLHEYEALDPNDERGAETLSTWTSSRMSSEVRAGLPAAERTLKRQERNLQEAQSRIADLNRQREVVNDRIKGIDGGAMQRLSDDLEHARQNMQDVRAQRQRIAEKFEGVEGTLPVDEASWNAKKDALARSMETFDERMGELEAKRDSAIGERAVLSRECDRLRRDYERKRSQKTRVTQSMDEARALLAQAVGLDVLELPYVAELMDVKQGEERWRAAMNVVYAPIAQTILVDRRHECGFAEKVSAVDSSVMIRRTWRFVDVDKDYDCSVNDGCMSSKMQFREDSPFAGWLRQQTASERLDALCVQCIDDGDRERRQVQVDGQIKSGAQGFYGSKGMSPVIGFVDEDYLAESKRQCDAMGVELSDVERRCALVRKSIDLLHEEKALADLVAHVEWSGIDEAGARALVENLERELELAENDPELAEFSRRLEQIDELLDDANSRFYRAKDEVRSTCDVIEAERLWLSAHDDVDFDDGALSGDVSNLLSDAYEGCFGGVVHAEDRPRLIVAQHGSTGRNSFEMRVRNAVARAAAERIESLRKRGEELRAVVEQDMASYLDAYAPDDDSVTSRVDDHRFYAEELRSLSMLVTREATDEEYVNSLDKLTKNFLQLNRAIKADQEDIKDQLERIDAMLAGQKFGPREGRLSIDVQFRPVERGFASALKAVLRRLEEWSLNDREDPDATRVVFASCSAFIERVRQELEQVRDVNGVRSYGSRNLDPRARSTFYAIVHHDDGRNERISSTGGKSGGALQELTSFVYGAALIYLLGGDVSGSPTYTTLFLDEALIKADGRYTQRALNVLPRLGFQVIVSAPESKTAEILDVSTKAYVAYKDPKANRSFLQEVTSEDIVRQESRLFDECNAKDSGSAA